MSPPDIRPTEKDRFGGRRPLLKLKAQSLAEELPDPDPPSRLRGLLWAAGILAVAVCIGILIELNR